MDRNLRKTKNKIQECETIQMEFEDKPSLKWPARCPKALLLSPYMDLRS